MHEAFSLKVIYFSVLDKKNLNFSDKMQIRRSPEHPLLLQYLRDNYGEMLVGLEMVTEFRTEEAGERPFYHCCLPDCFNEQGNSRQMMEHLVTR